MRAYYVYIMASKRRTLYTGVTNNLERRVIEHKTGSLAGFTKKHKIIDLVYYEEFDDIYDAIKREKEVKDWRRSKRVALIKSLNPKWSDLSSSWFSNS